MEENLRRKTILILGGAVQLPDGYTPPGRVSRSTAGPGAGSGSAVFRFGKYRVKKPVTYDEAEFQLVIGKRGRLSLTRHGKPFIKNIDFEPVVRHCPQQAFFDIDPRCMFRCAFCASPLLDPSEDKHLDSDTIMSMLEESMKSHEVRAVSFTSGVVGSVEETVGRFIDIVGRVREKYPDMPIGVEPYVSSADQIRMLRDAGATEIKINVQCARPDVYSRVCPDLNYDDAWDRLKEAVEVFGRGNVSSNLIYGMGETDVDIDIALERLCRIGAVPVLRAVRISPINMERMGEAGVAGAAITPERAMKLAEMQKSIMKRHGLTTEDARTMCLECGCCDLVPFRDF